MSVSDANSLSSEWRKARYSIACGDCIEVASAERHVAVRDSKDPDGGRISYPTSSWRSFVAKIKGE